MTQRTNEEVGAAIRARRVEQGLTQEGIEGISSSTIRKIERGELGISLHSKSRLAKALGWPSNAIDRLLAGDDPADLEESEDLPVAGYDARLSRLPADQLRRVKSVLDPLLDAMEVPDE